MPFGMPDGGARSTHARRLPPGALGRPCPVCREGPFGEVESGIPDREQSDELFAPASYLCPESGT